MGTDGWPRKALRKRTIFAKGRPASNLATVKGLIRYYIDLSIGMLSPGSIFSSVLFAERLFGGIARATGNECDEEDRSDVYHVSLCFC